MTEDAKLKQVMNKMIKYDYLTQAEADKILKQAE